MIGEWRISCNTEENDKRLLRSRSSYFRTKSDQMLRVKSHHPVMPAVLNTVPAPRRLSVPHWVNWWLHDGPYSTSRWPGSTIVHNSSKSPNTSTSLGSWQSIFGTSISLRWLTSVPVGDSRVDASALGPVSRSRALTASFSRGYNCSPEKGCILCFGFFFFPDLFWETVEKLQGFCCLLFFSWVKEHH